MIRIRGTTRIEYRAFGSYILALFSVMFFLTSGLLSSSALGNDWDDLVEAVLALDWKTIGNTQQTVTDQLYAAKIAAVITDQDNNNSNFADGDNMNLDLSSSRGDVSYLNFNGDRKEFEDWVEDNIDDLVEILFPKSLSQTLTGKDTAQNHAQQFLDAILKQKIRRTHIGGWLEYEWFSIDGIDDLDNIDGKAFQGIFRSDNGFSAIEFRASSLDDALNTSSCTIGVDFYPHFAPESDFADWSVGLDLFMNLLYANASDRNISAFDYGFGPWASMLTDFVDGRFSFGLGMALQISDTYIPTRWAVEKMRFSIRAVNDQAPDLGLFCGASMGFQASESVSLFAKIATDVPSQAILLIGPAYMTDYSEVSIGYKHIFDSDGINSSSIFLQGNFRVVD